MTRIVALSSDIDWNASFARDHQRLIAVLFCCALRLDAGGTSAGATISARKHVYLKSAGRQEASQSNGERCFAGAAGGEIADADDRVTQAPDRFPATTQAQFAESEA